MEGTGSNSPMHKKIKLDPTASAAPPQSAATVITDENMVNASSISSSAVSVPAVDNAAITDKNEEDTEAIPSAKTMETNDKEVVAEEEEEEEDEEEEEEEEEEDEGEDICLDILGNAALALEDAFVVDGTYPCAKVEIDFLGTAGETCTVEFPGRFKTYNKETNSTVPTALCSTLLSASDASPFGDNAQACEPYPKPYPPILTLTLT